jgi:hypothetical protein
MSSVVSRFALSAGLAFAVALLFVPSRAGETAAPATVPIPAAFWDTQPDTWAATDDLGRRVPTFETTGAPRPDRTVGMFYFLWHGAHIQGGPHDVTRILARDPDAMRKPDSPLWGPLHAPHHWGESLFGYYLTDDAGVLRKHAQMLADAGVDVVIFDVTNQITYRQWYLALLHEWSALRRLGNRTPQVAFLTPFWDPPKVVRELWRGLYAPGLHADLWFRWQDKPLLLADVDLLDSREDHPEQNTAAEIRPGRTLGQAFRAGQPFRAVSGRFPTYRATNSALTLTLSRVGADARLEPVVAERFERVQDNAWLTLRPPAPLPAGDYQLDASAPAGPIGWWSHTDDVNPRGQALADGQPAPGDRTLRLALADAEADRIREFFTFRKPQPDYFQGPTRPDMWSWLEVHPQHVFRNARGEKEQMSVGVAQNAVGGRLGTMSEPEAKGRSFHAGATDRRPDAVRHGLNLAEQWERALAEDPRFVFVTGWNEWIAGRFAEFNGVKLPVMFVDQFDQEHSRDIEPMRGGHGDDYYYQAIGFIRRYKGTRPIQPVSPRPIQIDGRFEDWRDVQPEFRDTLGDPAARRHPGWDTNVVYINNTGRNDLAAARVSTGDRYAGFYLRTREPLAGGHDPAGLLLFLDTDANPATGWLGYDSVVNRTPIAPNRVRVERNVAGRYEWIPAGEGDIRCAGSEVELAVPWAALDRAGPPSELHFKWADGIRETGDWTDFTLNGDVAPNDRFKYRAVFGPAPDR